MKYWSEHPYNLVSFRCLYMKNMIVTKSVILYIVEIKIQNWILESYLLIFVYIYIICTQYMYNVHVYVYLYMQVYQSR